MASNQAFTKDAWLSAVMGKNCFRVNAGAFDARALAELSAPGTFAYAKVDPREVALAGELEKFGFRLVDTNLQLSLEGYRGAPQARGLRTRFAARNEPQSVVAEVCQVAESAFEYTRFHLDPKVPRETANCIKREWVANFFRGERGDQLILAENENGKAVGFLLSLKSGNTTVIDLIATGREAQGRGVGREMVRALCLENPDTVIVGTQLANIPSLAFYQKLSFTVTGASYVFHYHSGSA